MHAPVAPRTASPGLTRTDLALYALTVVTWGTSWYPMKIQTATVAPEVSVLWRFVIATTVVWIVALARGTRLSYPLASHLRLAALGALLFCINFLSFYAATPLLPSGLLAVLFSLASPISLILSALVTRTRIEGRVLLGGLIGFGGVALLFAPEIGAAAGHDGAVLGVALALAGTLSFCCGTILSATLAARGIDVIAATAWGMVYGSIFLAATGVARGSAFVIEPTVAYIVSLILLAIFASVGALFCYLTLIRRIGAARTAYSTVLFPVIALAVSTALEDYQWTLVAAAGLALTLIGNVVVLTGRRA